MVTNQCENPVILLILEIDFRVTRLLNRGYNRNIFIVFEDLTGDEVLDEEDPVLIWSREGLTYLFYRLLELGQVSGLELRG